MSGKRTYMSFIGDDTYGLKIYIKIKTFKERDDRTEELIENGKEETEIVYEVERLDQDGDVVGCGSGETLEEAVISFERGW